MSVLNDVANRHEFELAEAVEQHNIALGEVAEEAGFYDNELSEQMRRFPIFFLQDLEKIKSDITEISDNTRSSVGRITAQTYREINDSVTGETGTIWQQAIKEAQLWGTQRGLGVVKAAGLRPLDTGFDDVIRRSAHRESALWGVVRAQGVAQSASSYIARNAIKASLDHDLWSEATRQSALWGVERAQGVARNASSDTVRDAMLAGLDFDVWQRVQREHKMWGLQQARGMAQRALSQLAKEAIILQLAEEPNSRMPKDYFRIRNPRNNFSFPRTEEPVSPQAEAKQPDSLSIMEDLLASPEIDIKTLRTYSRDDIRRVIATVLEARKRAAARGESITDREIYIRYRRAIAKIDADPNKVISAQILLLLMGNRVSGNLPF